MSQQQQQQQPTPILLSCLGCMIKHKNGSCRKLPVKYKGTLEYHDGTRGSRRILCVRLASHLHLHLSCLSHYYNKKLLILSNNKQTILSFSLSAAPPTDTNSIIQQRQCDHIQKNMALASRLGLTLTSNGPASSELQNNMTLGEVDDFNTSLDKQVMFNAFQPIIDRKLIDTLLSETTGPHLADITYDDDIDDDIDIDIDIDVLPYNSNDDSISDDDDKDKDSVSVSVLNARHKAWLDLPYLPARPQLAAEIELMSIMIRHKMPLCAYSTIFEWGRQMQVNKLDLSTNGVRHRDVVLKEIRQRLHMKENEFIPTFIEWLPDNHITQVYVRSFKDALYSLLSNTELMKEENLSFPDSRTPLSPHLYPKTNSTSKITELYHGYWWRESWKEACTIGSNEILVPIILYMDGISLDAHGRLSLTPLTFTLGIFSTSVRSKPEAWETLYFHPDSEFESSRHSRKPTAFESMQNLHRGLDAALKSFRDVCKEGGLDWNYLPYAGKLWKVRMKFAIAYVVGDTEQHDKLCGKYGVRTSTVKEICRHCNCPTDSINLPAAQKTTTLYRPKDLLPIHALRDDKYFKSISHHPIDNAFHKLEFGSHNPYNIHLATPGECLHMHQLGVAKRAIEAFKYLTMGKVDDDDGLTSTKK